MAGTLYDACMTTLSVFEVSSNQLANVLRPSLAPRWVSWSCTSLLLTQYTSNTQLIKLLEFLHYSAHKTSTVIGALLLGPVLYHISIHPLTWGVGQVKMEEASKLPLTISPTSTICTQRVKSKNRRLGLFITAASTPHSRPLESTGWITRSGFPFAQAVVEGGGYI